MLKKVTKTKAATTRRSKDLSQIEKDAVLDGLVERRLETLSGILTYGGFLGASVKQKISDVEIVACFCDLRGFTEYCTKLQSELQDRKIQNFLRDYLQIFNEGLMVWTTTWTDPDSPHYDPKMIRVAEYLVPTTYKHLGDGMLLVWEIP